MVCPRCSSASVVRIGLARDTWDFETWTCDDCGNTWEHFPG